MRRSTHNTLRTISSPAEDLTPAKLQAAMERGRRLRAEAFRTEIARFGSWISRRF